MAADISTNFKVNTNLPIDPRTCVQTLTDRDNIPLGVRYEGMETKVKEDGETYELKGGVDNSCWARKSDAFSIPDDVSVLKADTITERKFYKDGVLQSYQYNITRTSIIPVSPGDYVYSSSFKLKNTPNAYSGARVSFWKGGEWLSDVPGSETADADKIKVPEGADGVILLYYTDYDTEKELKIYSLKNSVSHIAEIYSDVKGILGGKNDNLFGNLYKTVKESYYNKDGVLTSASHLFTSAENIKVSEGDIVYASIFSYDGSLTGIKTKGIRCAGLKDGVFVKMYEPADIYRDRRIVVGAGINELSIPFYKNYEPNNRYLKIIKSGSMEQRLIMLENPDNPGPCQGKILSVLGDSISSFEGYVPEGNRTRYPADYLFTDVNSMWWKRTVDALGMKTGVIDAWAGSQIGSIWGKGEASGSDDRGYDKCMASEMRTGRLADNGTPDVIVVFGGTNDLHNFSGGTPLGEFDASSPIGISDEEAAALPVNTFYSAYRTMMIRLRRKYPKAKIIAVTPPFTDVLTKNTTSTEVYYTADKLNSYTEAIKKVCAYFGVSVIDTREISNLFDVYSLSPDGVHFGAEGHKVLADKIIKILV